jgi:SAM-dependent methyltransferase
MHSDSLYEQYHAQTRFKKLGVNSFHADKALAAYDDARAVLDFGCGNGYAVQNMRHAGHEWFGIEYSRAAYEKHLQQHPWFFVGEMDQFADRQFDMIYSTEVLEHIPESTVDDVIAHLCRVAERYLFLTISLRPSSDNNRYHCTLQSRPWWETRFTRHGWQIDRPVIDCFQKRTLKSTRRILSRWSRLGPACREFAKNPPYELHGEGQFWFFAFRRQGVPARPLPRPTVSYYRRHIVPQLRNLLGLDRRAA